MSDVQFSFASDTSPAVREIVRLQNQLDQLDRRILRLAGSTNASTRSYINYGSAAAGSAGRVNGLGAAASRAATSIRSTGTSAGSAASFLSRFGANAQRVAQQVKGADTQIRGMSGGMNLLNASIAGVGIGAIGSSIIETTAAFRGYNQGLKIVLGSQQAATSELKFVRDTALAAGFRVRDLTGEYVKLTAAAQGTTMAGRNNRAIFEALTRAGAAYSLTSEQMSGALTAVQQMMSKGKVSAEELRGQLGERLPGAFQIAARAMGMTTGQLDKMLQKGELMADVFLPKFADQLRKEIPAGTTTATAGFNRFLSSLDEAKVTIGESGFFDSLANAAEDLGKKLKEMAADGSLREFGKTLGDIAKTIVTLIPLIKPLVAAWIAYKVAAIAATVATNGLTAAMMRNPAGLIAVGIAALVGSVVAYSNSAGNAATASEAYANALKKVEEQDEKVAAAIRDMTSATDASRAAAIAAAVQLRNKAAASLQAASAALVNARAQREEAAAMARKNNLMSGIAVTGSTNLGAIAGSSQRGAAAQAKAEAAEKAAELEVTRGLKRLAELDGEIARARAYKPTVAGSSAGAGKSDKKTRGGSDKKAKEEDKYGDTIKKLEGELADLKLTEEELAYVRELEAAGLDRNIKLTDKRAAAIRKLVGDIQDAKKQKEYNDELKAINESTKALTLSEVQLAQIEARRRAGLSTDLAVTNAQTDAIDRGTAAIHRLTKAKADAEKADELRRTQATEIRDAELDGRGIREPEKVEHERQINAIMDARATRIAEIAAMEIITLEQRRAGMQGITEAERDAMLLAEQRLATQRLGNLEAERQQEALNKQREVAGQLSDFLIDLWENPKQAMKRFFADLLKRILMAIFQATILKNTLSATGGGGGIGSILGKAVLGAITGGRASGGSVQAGKTYKVGERGPEYVRFGAAGQVFNANKVARSGGGGSVTIAPTYNIQASGNAQQDQALVAALKQKDRQMAAWHKQQANRMGWTRA